MAAIRRRKQSKVYLKGISKLELINRLEDNEKFQDVLSILKSDDLLYEKWSATNEFNINDKKAKKLLEQLGLDAKTLISDLK